MHYFIAVFVYIREIYKIIIIGGSYSLDTVYFYMLLNNLFMVFPENITIIIMGIYLAYSWPILTNSIIWGNNPDSIPLISPPILPTASYSNIAGGWEWEGHAGRQARHCGATPAAGQGVQEKKERN